MLAQIIGVEHIYSTSSTGQGVVTLRYRVGEDREGALLNTYNKLYSNQSTVPEGVADWQVKPVEVDDIPILMLALYSKGLDNRNSDFELRRVAEELSTYIQKIPNTSEVKVVGGRTREVRIELDPDSLSARYTTARDVVSALNISNRLLDAGNVVIGRQSIQLESGDVYRSLDSLRTTVVNVVDGVPVTLNDVATLTDGPSEVTDYTWIDFASNHSTVGEAKHDLPMVALSIAKQPGSNAVDVSNDVLALVKELQTTILPSSMAIEVLRDYGQTANEKVDNLTSSLAFAVFTVVIFYSCISWVEACLSGRYCCSN